MKILHSIKTTALVALAMVCAGNAWAEGENDIVETFKTAISNASDGSTVTLTGDIDALSARFDVGKSITIDLGGYTIKPSITCGNGSAFNVTAGTVTIKNGTIDGSALTQTAADGYKNECDAITVRSGATVTLEDLTININSITGSCAYVFDGGKINIVSGTYTNTSTAIGPDNECGMLVNQPGNTTTQLVFVSGGTFYGKNPADGDNSISGCKSFLATNCISQTNADGSYTVGVPVAQVGTTQYVSLASAVAAAEANATVTLLANITLSQRVEPGKGMTIDLGGYTLTPTETCGNGSAFDIKSGNVIIQNGSIDGSAITATECDPITARSGSTITTKNLNITINSQTGACVYPFSGAKAYIESGVYKNLTTLDYPYSPASPVFKALCLNQANEEEQLVFVSGGTFYGQDPATGDDSQQCKSFLAEGYVSKHNATEGYYTVEPKVEVEINTSITGDNLTVAQTLLNNNATADTDVSEVITNGSLEIKLEALTVDDSKVTSATFDVTPKDENGNEVHNPSSPITFRLPVSSSIDTGTSAIVKHEETIIGTYQVQGADNKYLEISSSTFSKFSYTIGESVAKIGDVEYCSLADAFAAATEGSTITLLTDVDSPVEYINSANITLNLNGKTLSNGTTAATATLKNNGGKITITGNGTITNNTNNADQGIAVWARTGSIVIENGTFTNCSNYEATVYVGTSAATTATITINGGTFKNTAEGNYAYNESFKPLTVNAYNNLSYPSIIINGGTFFGNNPTCDDSNLDGSNANFIFVSAEKAAQFSEGQYSIVPSVAKIGNMGYATLADAVAAATEGTTVELLKDVTLAQRVEPAKSITIDLGGKTIYTTATCGNGSAFDVKGGNVTIQNGSIDGTQVTATECDAITTRSGSNVTLKNLNITINSKNGACVFAFDGSTITIESGVYENQTTETYEYNANMKAMCVNQANVTSQLIFIKGGTFKGQNPLYGDDSQYGSSNPNFTFLAPGFCTDETSDGVYEIKNTYTVVDGTDLKIIGKTFTVTNATYSRTMPSGTTWGTVCLPFNIKPTDDIKLYTVNKIDGSNLVLDEVDAEDVVAGTPVIFKFTSTTATFTTENATVNTAALSTTGTLVGTYADTKITNGLESIYFINSDAFHQAQVSLTVPAYRAYIIYNNGGSAKPRTLFISTPDETTAIDSMTSETLGTVESYYDVQGNRLQAPLTRGITIVRLTNGKTIKMMK